GQFARIVSNAISYADVFAVDGPLPREPDPDLEGFSDTTGSRFESDILALASVGITTGTGDGRFSPNSSVTRGQLATFLLRAADYLDRYQRWKPTAATAVLLAELRPVDDPDGDDAEPDPERDEEAPPGTPRPIGAVMTLTVNGFNGSLGYLIDLTDVPRGLVDDATLAVRLGAAGESGPLVVRLADGSELAAAHGQDGLLAGTVPEADSEVRLADLVVAVPDAYVELRGAELTLRGQMARVEPE
ncbi:MAG: S-layer homology domain-containing protein, partial [Nitriliruptoraceae bacterium]